MVPIGTSITPAQVYGSEIRNPALQLFEALKPTFVDLLGVGELNYTRASETFHIVQLCHETYVAEEANNFPNLAGKNEAHGSDHLERYANNVFVGDQHLRVEDTVSREIRSVVGDQLEHDPTMVRRWQDAGFCGQELHYTLRAVNIAIGRQAGISRWRSSSGPQPMYFWLDTGTLPQF